jgi:3-oxoadipate enol-lactonase / 4-carboxymuconolactone decarboxylase
MPFLSLGGTRLYFRFEDRRAERNVPIVLLHALGTDARLWQPVWARLAEAAPVVALDLPGHGLSDAWPTTPTIEELAGAVLELVGHLKLPRALVVGLSVGGLLAQQIAHQAPEFVQGLCLAATGLRIADPEFWQARRRQVEQQGLASLLPKVLERWFGEHFLLQSEAEAQGYGRWLERMDPRGYLQLVALLATTDLSQQSAQLRVPTLVLSGADDLSTPPANGERLAQVIAGARFSVLADCGHLLSIEQPQAFADALLGFHRELCAGSPGAPGARASSGVPSAFERGLAIRRSVLGTAHVDRALQQQNNVDAAFQDYITRNVWGEVWARPGLERRQRHLLTIALLAGLGREEELALHLRSVANTGVTVDEVREALLQVAVYAGVPAANSAFRIAKQVFGSQLSSGGVEGQP